MCRGKDEDYGCALERKHIRHVRDRSNIQTDWNRQNVLAFGGQIEKELKERFEQIDQIAEYNQLKVIQAMQENRVSEGCFNYASGYGYDELGGIHWKSMPAYSIRKARLYARRSHAGPMPYPSPLARTCVRGRTAVPGRKPYDTLEEVIGIRPSCGSLAEYGVSYRQVDLLEDGTFDYDRIRKAIGPKTCLVTIQRSKVTRPGPASP